MNPSHLKFPVHYALSTGLEQQKTLLSTWSEQVEQSASHQSHFPLETSHSSLRSSWESKSSFPMRLDTSLLNSGLQSLPNSPSTNSSSVQ